MKNNKKILALLMFMLISGSMEVYASGLNITTANPNANIYNTRAGGYNFNASSTGLKGDVNGDGTVNSDDLKLLKQYLRNSATAINKKDADMNNDGIINYVDYNLLVYFLNPPKPILKGDVNRDGKIDEADYKLLSQYVAGMKVSSFYHYNADMNDDKKFTSTDLSQLRTKLNSMRPTLTDSYTVFNIPNGWYEIAPLANERMRLDVDGAREGNEVNIKLYNSNGNVAQRFYVNNVGNGYFTLRTGCNGYVDLRFGQTSNGSNIWQYEKEAANGKCQKFRAIRRNNDPGVFIEPLAKAGIAVACANNSAAAQTNVVVWARENNNYQKWRFIQTSAAPVPVNVDNGLYSIQPQCAPNSELTVLNASKDRSVPVVIYSKNSQNHKQKSHQKWQVTKLNNGYYKITAENSGLALNNHNGSNANGNPITLWDYSGFCQEFRFLDAGNGYYIIQPKNVNGVLDVSGGGSANNTKIQLFQYNGSAAQKWKLERRNPGEDERYKEWSEWPKRNCDVFENANLTEKKGRVDTADPVTVFEETGSSYHIRYKTNSGGMKEGWVTRDIFNSQHDVLNKLMNTIYSRDGARLLCDFDGYTGTYKKKGYRHEGIDVSLYDGAPVYATISGYVLQAGGDKLNTFSIKDGTNNRIVVYLHMKNVISSYKNQYIKKGTLIGYQGSQGTSSSHVHIEVTNGRYGKAEISMDTVLKNQNPYSYWKKVLF